MKAVNVILKNLGLEKGIEKVLENKIVAKAINIVKNRKVLVKTLTLILIGVAAISVSITATGITVGFNVEYSGEVIATVSETSVAENAREIVINTVEGKNVDKALSPTNLALTLTVTDNLENADAVADSIMDKTGEIVDGASLTVNGSKVTCTDSETLNSLMEARRTAFYIEGAENEATFVDDVQVIQGKFLSYEMDNPEYVKNVVNNLQVKTVSTITEDETVAYSSKIVYSNKYEKGYSKVTTQGVNGISRKVEQVEYINSNQVSKKQVSYEVIKNPVTKVTTFGTKSVRGTSTKNAVVSSAGFICPINKGQYTVTSYWGDGRGHKGLDLAAKTGVSIFAAAPGTVVESGYKSDYGYYITIDHGNGIKTRYAHCNTLGVGKGAKVSRGSFIATVGNTGRSTGSHLHFEILVNGTRINPAPYIPL